MRLSENISEISELEVGHWPQTASQPLVEIETGPYLRLYFRAPNRDANFRLSVMLVFAPRLWYSSAKKPSYTSETPQG